MLKLSSLTLSTVLSLSPRQYQQYESYNPHHCEKAYLSPIFSSPRRELFQAQVSATTFTIQSLGKTYPDWNIIPGMYEKNLTFDTLN